MKVRRAVGGVLSLMILGACDAVPPILGPGSATWALPDGFTIGTETTHFLALVTERDCASGQSSEDRVIGPEIEYGADHVTVTFRVERPPGGAHDCQGNPATMVEVELAEPLGHRTLLDGGRQPPAEPPVCVTSPFCE